MENWFFQNILLNSSTTSAIFPQYFPAPEWDPSKIPVVLCKNFSAFKADESAYVIVLQTGMYILLYPDIVSQNYSVQNRNAIFSKNSTEIMPHLSSINHSTRLIRSRTKNRIRIIPGTMRPVRLHIVKKATVESNTLSKSIKLFFRSCILIRCWRSSIAWK